MSKTKTPSQLATAVKKKANLKNTAVYLDPTKTAAFCNWLKRKERYNKLVLNEYEDNIMISLDRIKKIYRNGGLRIYQFIQKLSEGNHSFYMILDGFGGQIETTKLYPIEKIKN